MATQSNDPPPTPADTHGHGSAYAVEACEQDKFLDEKIAGIRAQFEAGSITVREAADMRVAAYEHHLAAVRALRVEYFGDGA
jgi:hypothetical protein